MNGVSLNVNVFSPSSSQHSPVHEYNKLIVRVEVESLAQELTCITSEALRGADDDEDIKNRAPSFGLFFGQLRRLLCGNVQPGEELVSPTAQLAPVAAKP